MNLAEGREGFGTSETVRFAGGHVIDGTMR